MEDCGLPLSTMSSKLKAWKNILVRQKKGDPQNPVEYHHFHSFSLVNLHKMGKSPIFRETSVLRHHVAWNLELPPEHQLDHPPPNPLHWCTGAMKPTCNWPLGIVWLQHPMPKATVGAIFERDCIQQQARDWPMPTPANQGA